MPHHHTPHATTTEDWVDAKAVAKSLGVHVKTVLRWANGVAGFPHHPIGKREKRFVLSEVKAFLAEHPERLQSASEDYSTRRTLDAAKKKPKKKGPP